MKKPYYYTDLGGDHFPDASVGDNLYYTIDLSCWLQNENDTISAVTWELPDGLSSDDAFLQGNLAKIKIHSERAGNYRLKCIVSVYESTKTQDKVVPMMLKVY